MGLKTAYELRGTPCINLDHEQPTRRSMTHTRSFPQEIYDIDTLSSIIASFTSKLASKLRKKGLITGHLSLFLASHRFKEDYTLKTLQIDLHPPTSDTRTLIKEAKRLLLSLYTPQLGYKRAGVLFTNLMDEASCPLDAFSNNVEITRENPQLMKALDAINQKQKKKCLFFGSETLCSPSKGSQQRLYTTSWKDILHITL